MKKISVIYFVNVASIVLFLSHFCVPESDLDKNEFIANKAGRNAKNPYEFEHSTSDAFKESSSVCTSKKNEICRNDYLGFEAISALHSQIDDDQNGNLDQHESRDFLKEDLKRDGYSSESHYHENDDLVSIHDLWNFWIRSEVHNWTTEDVIKWLDVHVELGQYSGRFRVHEIDGSMLPRLACSIHNPLFNLLGIKNVIHRQKISLKATDIVLFGIPKSHRSIFSDTLFAFSVLLALAGCGLGYRQHKMAREQLQALANDLRTLQVAEDALKKFQARLEESQRRQREEADKRDELKRKLINREFQVPPAEDESGNQKITCIQDELVEKRFRLMQAEQRLEECKRASIPDLQQWLQMTYEVESRYFEQRRSEVIKKLQNAKQMCESMRRQKMKLLGSIRSSSKSADLETLDVKRSLEDIEKDLEERALRWKEIERIMSFNIIMNPGIPYLNTLLRGPASSVLTIPTMMQSPSVNKISSIPGHLGPYPIMSNLLKAGMQLSAVGVNTSMIASHEGLKPNQETHVILPKNLSHASLLPLVLNGLSSRKFLSQNSAALKSSTPPDHSRDFKMHSHNSVPSFYAPSTPSTERHFDSEGNINNSSKDSPKFVEVCNGHGATGKGRRKFTPPQKTKR